MQKDVPFKYRWLSDGVPDHWKIVEPRRIFKLRREPEKPDDTHLTPSQKYGVLPQEEYVRITGSRVVQNLSGTQMQHVEPGDFISHLRTFQGGLELVTQPGKVSPAYTVLQPTEAVFPGYFKHVFKSESYISQIASVTDQLRDGQSMRYNEFNLTWLPLPPYQEQIKMAEQLDRELAEIDELIADQQILSRLQHEKFRSHLSRSIQPGDSDIFSSGRAENKYDGAIWRRTKLGHVMEVNGGQVDPRVSPYSAMTLIAPNHIESGTGKLLYTESAEEQGADSGKYQVKEGQVIFSKIRPTLLKSTIAPEDCLCSADMYGLNGKPRVLNNEFLMYYLLSDRFLAQAAVNSDRVAMPKLNRESLFELSIWLPDITHQTMISESIKRTQSRMNLLAGNSSAFLELLSKKVLATTRKVLEA